MGEKIGSGLNLGKNMPTIPPDLVLIDL